VGDTEPERLAALGVPEVLLTLGAEGAVVVTRARIEGVPAHDVDEVGDPTGAGDTFSAAYLVARVAGAAPLEAARSASATVGEFLSRR
jgi:2-dehydro-3-deoxygluconokinase